MDVWVDVVRGCVSDWCDEIGVFWGVRLVIVDCVLLVEVCVAEIGVSGGVISRMIDVCEGWVLIMEISLQKTNLLL